MSDRKPLISKNDNIINNLTQFYSEITEFERSVKDIGTSRDTTTFRGILHKKKINLGDDLKVMSQQIKQLPQSGQSKVQQDKIVKQFKEAHSKFEELLSLSNKKEQQHEPIVPSVQQQQPVQQQQQIQQQNNNNTRGGYGGGYGNNNNVYNNNNNNNNNGGYDYQTNGNNEADIDRLEQALQDNTVDQDNNEFYGRIIDERNAQTKALAQDMLMLNEAMKDVAVMVGEQGVLLEKADDNVEKADYNVEDAVVELEKAYVYKTSYRKKMVILIICLIVTAAAVGLFLAIYFGVIKKKGSSHHTDDDSSYSDDSHHSSSSHHHSSSSHK